MFNYEKVEERMLTLLSILNGSISKDAEDELKELITHNESGLAYKDICSIISLYKIPISISDYEMIEEIGRAMKYDEETWSKLKDLTR